MLGEDVQDQGGPVDHLDPQLALQLAQLTGRQLPVADHGVRTGRHDDVGEFTHLAGTDVGGGVRAAAPLDEALQHLGAGGLGEPRQFDQGRLGLLDRSLCPHSDQDHALQAQAAVLDLGDVGEFGGQPGHAAQSGAVGQFQVAG